MPKRLTLKQASDRFLDLWYEQSPETYDTLWYDGIYEERLISDFVIFYPRLYRKILDKFDDELRARRLSC